MHAGPGGLREARNGEPRGALLPCHLALTDRPGQPGVAERPFGEHHEMLAGRVGDPVRRLAHPDREFGPEDRGELDRLGRHGETDDAVEAVMVGHREGGQAETGRFIDELLRVAGAVEEREVGVAMQLGVHGETSTTGVRTLPNTCSIGKRRPCPLAGPSHCDNDHGQLF